MIQTTDMSSYVQTTGDDIPVVKLDLETSPDASATLTPAEPVTPAVVPVEPVTPVTPEVVPPAEPVITPAVTEPVIPVAPVVPTTPAKPEFKDEDVFSYLSEKLGIKVENFENLKPQAAPELDPQVKEIDEWRKRTGRPLADWVKFQKDPSTLTDIEAVRESLRLKYPTITDAQLQHKLNRDYVSTEDDLDDERADKEVNLVIEAAEARKLLQTNRLELDMATAPMNLPREIQEDLVLAQNVKAEAVKSAQFAEQYNTGLQTAASAMEKLTLTLGEGINIDYSVPLEDRNRLPEFVNTMPHWKNADGTPNTNAVINDAVKILHFEKLLKIAYDQGVASGTDQNLVDINNTTLQNRQPLNVQNPASTGYQVEGYDKMLKGNRVQIGNAR